MLEILSTIIPSAYASWSDAVAITSNILSREWVISIMWLFALFVILITEKVDKTLVSTIVARQSTVPLRIHALTGLLKSYLNFPLVYLFL